MWQEDYQILSELIAKDALVIPTSTNHNSKEAILTEIDDDNDVEYSIKIKGLPHEVIIIKADKFPPPTDFFQGSQDECKRADYIILTHVGNQKYAIFLELKLGNPDNQEIIKQIKGAFCLFKYCQTLGQVFWETPLFLEEYKIRFVVIKKIPNKIRLKKRTTGLKRDNLIQQIPVNNINVPDMPNYCLSFQHQEEIYLKKLLNRIP